MNRKKNRRYRGHSYKNASDKRQRMRKAAQKQEKYSARVFRYAAPLVKQSRQRGA